MDKRYVQFIFSTVLRHFSDGVVSSSDASLFLQPLPNQGKLLVDLALVIQPSTLAALLKLVRKSCIHREVDDDLVCSLNLADIVELYVVS